MINRFFDFITIINWNYAGSILFGALITSIISYFLVKKREINKLRIELQFKAAEQLLEHIKSFDDASSQMYIKDFSIFSAYNSSLLCYKEAEDNYTDNDDFNANKTNKEIRNKQIECEKETANKCTKCINDFLHDYQLFQKSFSAVINILESKEVILNKYIGFKHILLVEYGLLFNIHEKRIDLYFNEISQSIINSKEIKDVYLENLQDYGNEFKKKQEDIRFIIWDLRVGLQNEFLSKIFKYKVPERQPIDKKSPVYKPGYKYQPVENRKEP